VGVGDVKRRTEVAIERLQLGERERIIRQGQPGLREALGDDASIASVSVRMPRGVTIAGTRPLGLTVQ
jgi:hypothetical protein